MWNLWNISIDTLAKIVIPLAIFVLGTVITIWFKKSEQKRNTIHQHVEKSSKLVIDWYKQIHDLAVKLRDGTGDTAMSVVMFNYVHSREVLPQLQQSVGVLRRYKRSRKLVAHIEKFQAMVTYCPREDIDSLSTIFGKYYSDDKAFLEACTPIFNRTQVGLINWNISLEELDSQLQKIQFEAANILSRT